MALEIADMDSSGDKNRCTLIYTDNQAAIRNQSDRNIIRRICNIYRILMNK